MINLEKIDYVINTTGAGYELVREALLNSDGDVDRAIGYIEAKKFKVSQNKKDERIEAEAEIIEENESKKDIFGGVTDTLDEIIQGIKEIWRKGNASRLIVEKDNETVLSLSLTASTFGAIIAPIASILGLTVAYITDYDFKIIMADGKIIDVREYIKNKSK